ncbi:DNA primase DnaG [Natronomonas moolapensis 8.8.11]|uniref:DNA primase DnaG n=1 Tax=Natronomonas moolapensis (strain DSM 18674 / CECT 7526 / JCM 14361 / 8.8.11) TaxID=268739 RepID=M1XQW4_NATM8|nr:DNA primase DnaG [Natronomonas moolapensis]CCQ36514.1 DNA primase DnaG [Natronomonas moolapensis 8.8.11]
MQDTAKYLVHADITAEGIVERSDVVGAVFGQTEGLLGDELDLRELQDSSKVGRIDVEIDSQNGQSFGRITIATSLDRVETAILGAALETIDRVGPCRSTIEVRKIEDVRAARRRQVVERAKVLFGSAFDESIRSSSDLVEEVRQAVRIEDITEYEELPAGPRVADSDAIIVVEGRSDVLTLLQYGIKNAVAVEGTNVPEQIAELTESRTVTAFLDGDRGGELIRRELAQVGDIDYVARAPEDRSVEDLDRHEVMTALREKVPYERFEAAEAAGRSTEAAASGEDTEASDGDTAIDRASDTAGSATVNADPDAPAGRPSDSGHPTSTGSDNAVEAEAADATAVEASPEGATQRTSEEPTTADAGESADSAEARGSADAADDTDHADTDEATDDTDEATDDTDEATDDGRPPAQPDTLRGHTRAVIGESSGRVHLLDAEYGVLSSGDAAAAFERLVDAEPVPTAVVVDAELDQRLLDVAAQRGVEHVVAASTGEFVKRPTSVRIRTVDQLLASNEA